MRGELALGAVLSRRKLATEFGMSLLPVSEALQRLENEGLVESKPRVGTRVRVPSLQDVRERYVVREALECQSARLFAEQATPQERQELQRMAEHTDVLFNQAATGHADPEFMYQVHSYHFSFHMRVAEYGRCGALREAIEKNQVLIFNWLYDVAAHRRALPPRFHRELTAVLCGGDPDAAEKAMRDHVRWGLEQTVQNLAPRACGEWRLRRTS